MIFRSLYWKTKNAWDLLREKIQRFRRGYAWIDVWNIHRWFVDNMIPMLTRLRDHGSSWPGEGWEGAETQEAWNETLTEMIDGFKLWRDADDFNLPDKRFRMNEEERAKFDRAMKLIVKHFETLWD